VEPRRTGWLELLDETQGLLTADHVITAHEEMGREGTTERMAGGVLGDAGPARCVVEGSLDRPLVEVMALQAMSR
jgi:hypothetical protein